MADIASEYGIPENVMRFVRDGFLEVLSENPDEKTVEFHIPAARRTDTEGRITTCSVVWIHPAFNAQFCHYYEQTPGDLPNFYVREDTTDVGDEDLEIHSVDELEAWLENVHESLRR